MEISLYLKVRRYLSKRYYYIKTWIKCRFNNIPIVYVVGESHTNSFNFQFPFYVRHIEGATAYNIMKENSSSGTKKIIFSVVNKLNKRKDKLMLVFGEIDCRMHIYKQYIKSKGTLSFEQIIDRTLDNYFIGVNKIVEMGVKPIIYGIPPTSYQGNKYGIEHYASPPDQHKIKKLYNDKLKLRSEELGLKYIEVFYRFADKDGFILDEFCDDGLHLTTKILPYIKDSIIN